MDDRHFIQASVDGALVTGEIILLTPGDLQVRIISSCAGLVAGRHILPHAANAARYADEAGNLTEHGARTAERLLLDVYSFCQYVATHRNALRTRYGQYRDAVAVLERRGMNERRLEKERRLLRRRLNAGEIGAAEYDTRLADLRNAYDRLVLERDGLWQVYFEGHFPYGVPVFDREQVFTLLESL